MIKAIIRFSAENKYLVLAATLVTLALLGVALAVGDVRRLRMRRASVAAT